LLIHGGSYQVGDKSDLKDLCESLANQGNIAATMAHTFLNNSNFNSTIFRILDEIATVIKSIKNNLKEKGFNETKLEIAIGGASSGSHLALLYAYSYKNSPLEIKYAINMIGPVTYESQYFYVLINKNDTLDQIDEESIKKYEEEKKIMPLYVGPYFVQLMNIFLGYNEYNNLFPMIKSQETWEIDTESPAYKELLEKAKLSFPITHVNKDTPPTICFYTGKDTFVGVKQYSYLKSVFEKNENEKIDLIYVKGLNHAIYVEGSEEAKVGLNQLFGKIAEYSQRYFTPNTK
jgi:acetyl esterase/lipase